MPSARSRRLLAVTVCILGGVLTLATSTASAALTQTPFGCRASVLRATLGSGTVLEPYIANKPQTPCATASDGLSTGSVPTSSSGGSNPLATVGPGGAFTDSAFDPTGKTAPGAAAVTSVNGLTVPTSGGTVYVAGPITATASYECVNNQVVASASSTLDVIYVNGVAHDVPPSSAVSIPLGSGAVTVNQVTKTATSETVDLVHIFIPNSIDVTVGEAVVSQSIADPCAGTSGEATPVLEICPPGSTLDAAAQLCVIEFDGKTIVVSRPFRGPSGGTVYALPVARKKYPHSPCVYGAGPKYALIATKQGGRVEGTAYSDRILAVGSYERVAGIGGNDCLDGIGKTEKLFDGNGKERIYSSGGSNRIAVGNGNDLIDAGNGNDTITAGNGNDTIRGGGGNDRINSGVGKNHLFGNAGKNRIYTVGARSVVNCGPGGHNEAFLRHRAIRYAMSHGCTKVVHLQ